MHALSASRATAASRAAATRPADLVNRGLLYARRSRVVIALARAAATAPLRLIDPTDPQTWEFSAFSAGGEDGILDYLTRRMRRSEGTFLEIGASDGLANNTAWLAVARKWSGVMIDADAASVRRAARTLAWFNPMVTVLELCVDERRADAALRASPGLRPDVFSLDIDGIDLVVARALFMRGLRPRLCVVEYNAAYGPERSCAAHSAEAGPPLLYGASITAWRRFFAGYGYRFLGVESTGVNAFFADPESFDPDFLDHVQAVPFRENAAQRRRYGAAAEDHLLALQSPELVEI